MVSKAARREAVYDLLQLRCPLNESLARLAAFDWPYSEYLAVVEVRDISHALDEFEAGRIGADELSAWAEEVQGREDVGVDSNGRDFIADAIFQLSTPEICGPANEVALALRQRMT
ncbi:hypothetical protein [Pseudarthrobacter sp. NamE5]|uniref:hypothetical protein n=1 Tax=Pseudarthrobacter sp. NamE5 TaxID=2576839 RepID=UPI00110BFE22|nr:hypothetical protein [Pseudarthrobacter sp. NamE5]TLM80810.1 hypothetical protein FDW84_18335 [Pseudarthrobacter sp. NamE5]